MHRLSEQEKAEAFTVLMSIVPIAVILKKPNGVIHATNPQFQKALNSQPADVIDKHYFTLLNGEEAQREIQNAKLMTSGQVSVYTSSESLNLPNGQTTKVVRIEGAVITGENGEQRELKMFLSVIAPEEEQESPWCIPQVLKDVLIWVKKWREVAALLSTLSYAAYTLLEELYIW